MSITIKRNTNWLGSGTNCSILLNGKKVAKIARNQKINLDISNEKTQLRVSQFGSKSNEVDVTDGDIVEIKTGKGNYINIFAFFIYILSLFFIQNSTQLILMLIIFFGVLIANEYLIGILRLEVSNSQFSDI